MLVFTAFALRCVQRCKQVCAVARRCTRRPALLAGDILVATQCKELWSWTMDAGDTVLSHLKSCAGLEVTLFVARWDLRALALHGHSALSHLAPGAPWALQSPKALAEKPLLVPNDDDEGATVSLIGFSAPPAFVPLCRLGGADQPDFGKGFVVVHSGVNGQTSAAAGSEDEGVVMNRVLAAQSLLGNWRYKTHVRRKSLSCIRLAYAAKVLAAAAQALTKSADSTICTAVERRLPRLVRANVSVHFGTRVPANARVRLTARMCAFWTGALSVGGALLRREPPSAQPKVPELLVELGTVALASPQPVAACIRVGPGGGGDGAMRPLVPVATLVQQSRALGIPWIVSATALKEGQPPAEDGEPASVVTVHSKQHGAQVTIPVPALQALVEEEVEDLETFRLDMEGMQEVHRSAEGDQNPMQALRVRQDRLHTEMLPALRERLQPMADLERAEATLLQATQAYSHFLRNYSDLRRGVDRSVILGEGGAPPTAAGAGAPAPQEPGQAGEEAPGSFHALAQASPPRSTWSTILSFVAGPERTPEPVSSADGAPSAQAAAAPVVPSAIGELYMGDLMYREKLERVQVDAEAANQRMNALYDKAREDSAGWLCSSHPTCMDRLPILHAIFVVSVLFTLAFAGILVSRVSRT